MRCSSLYCQAPKNLGRWPQDERFKLSVIQNTNEIGEYERRYVTREINGLWYKFKDEPRGIIWVGDY